MMVAESAEQETEPQEETTSIFSAQVKTEKGEDVTPPTTSKNAADAKSSEKTD
jgi:hypothetical protein